MLSYNRISIAITHDLAIARRLMQDWDTLHSPLKTHNPH